MNDANIEELCAVKYISFDEAMKIVCYCGIGAELAKCNIKSTFCLLSVHPATFTLLVCAFERQFYVVWAFSMCCSIYA